MSNHLQAIEAETADRTTFGFWVYLMTDCVLFAVLFATYAVLHNNTFDGATSKELFHLPSVLQETLLLLTSSFTCGLAMLAMHRQDKKQVIFWFVITGLLGIAFLGMELSEFRNLIAEGNSWRESAFLSSFFTLVATHGIHIASGILWIIFMMIEVSRRGLTSINVRRLTCLSLFWHFLDVVWIFIFSFVYLMGAR